MSSGGVRAAPARVVGFNVLVASVVKRAEACFEEEPCVPRSRSLLRPLGRLSEVGLSDQRSRCGDLEALLAQQIAWQMLIQVNADARDSRALNRGLGFLVGAVFLEDGYRERVVLLFEGVQARLVESLISFLWGIRSL